jgi:hypothetical protein
VLAGKGTIAQLNYNRVGTGLPFHRATVQRLIRDLLAKLGSHILCNRLLQVNFSLKHFLMQFSGLHHSDCTMDCQTYVGIVFMYRFILLQWDSFHGVGVAGFGSSLMQ